MQCVICGKAPSMISEYTMMAEENGFNSPEDFVRSEEGTYNPSNDLFCCTGCYIKIGMPLGVATTKWRH